MRLLIVGDPEDLTAAYLGYRAEERGVQVLRLDEGRFGFDWHFALDDEDRRDDRLWHGGESLALAEANGAYVRFHHAPASPALDEIGPELAELYLSQRRSALHLLLGRLPCRVANRPLAGQANGSKPYQMQLLARGGLKPPRWIASNEVDSVRAFAASCPAGCVVKSCSGLRSEVRLMDEALLARLADGSAPVIVQERVPGHDVRLHSVGQRCFATRIVGAEGIDYRFAEEQGRYESGDAPPEIAERCLRFAADEGLLIAGFDFRVTPEGEWWCLECNPVPTFLPYEMATKQPIADALLDCLLA